MLDWDQKLIESRSSSVGLPEWMAGVACPAWSTTVWDTGLALWPDILSDEQRMDLQLFFIELRSGGSFVVRTGQFTGRSPKDKFVVRDETTDAQVNWGDVNQRSEERRIGQECRSRSSP